MFMSISNKTGISTPQTLKTILKTPLTSARGLDRILLLPDVPRMPLPLLLLLLLPLLPLLPLLLLPLLLLPLLLLPLLNLIIY
jgi:hypothetical protein